jgi:hypothetical protein
MAHRDLRETDYVDEGGDIDESLSNQAPGDGDSGDDGNGND